MDGNLYEYACHEGNYSMAGILAGARIQEVEAELGPSSGRVGLGRVDFARASVGGTDSGRASFAGKGG